MTLSQLRAAIQESEQRTRHAGKAPRAEALEPLLYDRLGDPTLTRERRVTLEMYLLAVGMAIESGQDVSLEDEARMRWSVGE